MDNVLVSLCSHVGVRVNVLSAFWFELRRANLSPGLQHVELAKVVVKLWKRGSAFWRDNERPCIIQRELSATPDLPGIICLNRVHLCAHWKKFISRN